MATLKRLPELSIISGFKGTIDFYVYKGLACARRWPRSPGHRRAPAVEARWPAFTYATKMWNNLPYYLQDAYRRQAAGTYLSGRDLFVKSFIQGDFIKLE